MGGFGFNWRSKNNARTNKEQMIISVPDMPSFQIRKPPAAWPVTDAESQVPCVQVVAFCNICRGTTDASTAEKVGPVNALTIPVQNITA